MANATVTSIAFAVSKALLWPWVGGNPPSPGLVKGAFGAVEQVGSEDPGHVVWLLQLAGLRQEGPWSASSPGTLAGWF